jgi:CBS domain containing-hemolysin-like protein
MLLFVSAVSVVLVASFLCSIFESVLLSLTRPQIEIMIRNRRRAGHLLSNFKSNMDVPIAAILILNTAAHTIGAAVAGASYTNVFSAGTLWIFSLVFTVAVLLFTEIIPKTLGVSYATALASPVAHGIRFLTIVLRPLVILSERISRSLRRGADAPVTSAEEIRLLAILGESEGAVGSKTVGIIVGATQLRDMHAQDIILPRDQVRYLSSSMSRSEALDLMSSSGHSRFPFTPTQDINNVTGIVLAKALLFWMQQNDAEQIDWNAIVTPGLVVPSTMPVLELLRTFQHEHRHMAIVVDEYGGVEGIVTLEDVIEEIVGEIHDETDKLVPGFRERPDGSLQVRADVDLRKLSARLGLAWKKETDAATLGGLIIETLKHIPSEGESILWQGHRIEVVRADRRRVRLLSVRKEPVEQ